MRTNTGRTCVSPGLMFFPRGSRLLSFASYLRSRFDAPLRPRRECGLTGSEEEKTQWSLAQ